MNLNAIKFSGVFALFLLVNSSTAQPVLPYKNPSLPIEARVKDLLSRMTPEEKFWQLFMIPGDLDPSKPDQYKNGIFGFQVNAQSAAAGGAQQMLHYNVTEEAARVAARINGIQRYFVEHTRLGIPIIAFDEALHGLVRQGATAFPQSIALAATWDTTLVARVSSDIAQECRWRGIRQILSPVLNIASDPRWGRTEETYGEDPLLASAMGLAFVSRLEKAGVITTPKHFVANSGDGGRDSYPIHADERELRERYLPPFKTVVEEGGARSIMTSYNSVDGSPASAQPWLLDSLLKKEWGFPGFVISDAGGVGGANVLHFTAKDYPDAGRQAIEAGLDVIFQTAYQHYLLFQPPFLDGSIRQARIDDAVSRVLRAKFELGLFEHPYVDPLPANQAELMEKHRQDARLAAQESMVLLKNTHNCLPIGSGIKKLAVIGTDATEGRLGGYSGPGNKVISILEGIRRRAGKQMQVSYAPGCGREEKIWNIIPTQYLRNGSQMEPGLKGDYFNNMDLSGEPVLQRTDAQVNFRWTLFGPDSRTGAQFYSARWEGKLVAPETGRYNIGLEGDDGFRMYINGRLLVNQWDKRSYHLATAPFDFVKGKTYDVRIEFYETTGDASLRLIWNYGINRRQEDEAITSAEKLLKQSDMGIVVAGIHEGEFQDRAHLTLPGRQEEMIRKLTATGKPVVVLLVGGSAVIMKNWIDKVGAVLDCWYPGEAGGDAVAAVLFGDANPSGKLPLSFPSFEGQLPLVYNHLPTGRGDDYYDLSGLPAYPFGYGLSYTQFRYNWSGPSKWVSHAADTVYAKCTITNSGGRAGDEVMQLYIHDELASLARPVMELKSFRRVHLEPGETREVIFALTPAMLQMLNRQMQWVAEPGDFRIMIGSSSRDIRLQGTLSLQ